MTYLADLTLRLATGVGQLPEDLRTRIANFYQAAQRSDGGFAGREGPSDLYYTGFGLRGLALTGQLYGDVADRAAKFLIGQLHNRVAIVDFLSLVYGAMLIENAAGIDVFARSGARMARPWPKNSNASAGPTVDTPRLTKARSSSTYYSFLMVLCLELIDRPVVEPERLAAFVNSRKRIDGGFVEMGPMQRSGTNPTAAAIGLLKVLKQLDETTCECSLDFLLDMQNDEGGLRANTRIPMADVLSTFTGLLTLSDLGGLDEVDLSAARGYVESMELPDGGFRGGIWDGATDVEYTFYGLGTLALLAEDSRQRAVGSRT